MTPDGLDERFDARFFHRAARVISPFVHVWFRYRLRGLDRLPSGVPALLVGNHSAWGTAEILCFLVAWAETLGESRRVNGLMHDAMLATPLVGAFYRRIGAVPATSDSGHAALSAGHDVLVFPGGDIDSCRPFYEPRKVRFGARRGYVRLALEAGVPVCPIATIGSHYTWLMAPGGGLIARTLGLPKRLRAHTIPLPLGWLAIVGAIAMFAMHLLPWWGLLTVVVAGLVPNPVQITSEVLPPIDLRTATAHLAGDAAKVEHAHALVYGALADAVARMEHGRPFSGGEATG